LLGLLLLSSGYLGLRLLRQGSDARPRLRPGELAQARTAALAIVQHDTRAEQAELWQRAIATLGQLHDGGQRPALEVLLGSTDPALASAAAEALGQLGEREAGGALGRLLTENGNANLRLSAARSLLLLGDPRGEAYL